MIRITCNILNYQCNAYTCSGCYFQLSKQRADTWLETKRFGISGANNLLLAVTYYWCEILLLLYGPLHLWDFNGLILDLSRPTPLTPPGPPKMKHLFHKFPPISPLLPPPPQPLHTEARPSVAPIHQFVRLNWIRKVLRFFDPSLDKDQCQM